MTEKMIFTNHCKEDRLERIAFILANIGKGEIVLTVKQGETRACLTDTGVVFIKAAVEEVLITAFVPSVKRVLSLYHEAGVERIPHKVYKAAQSNQKFRKILDDLI